MDRRNADAIFADALALARQASDYDKSGQAEAAIVHYRNAIGLFQEASAMDKNLRTDVNKQAYCKLAQNRLDHLLAVQNPPDPSQLPPQKGSQEKAAEAHLLKAVQLDEKRNYKQAKISYQNAIEKYLAAGKAVSSESDKQRLMKRAHECLERAERLTKLIAEESTNALVSSLPPMGSKPAVASSGSSSLGPSSSRQSPSTQVHAAAAPAHRPHGGAADAGPRLSAKEIQLLKNSSFINGKCYVPWIDQDMKSKVYFSEPYSDRDGLLALSPKQKEHLARWARPVEICDNPKVFHAISHESIKQTLVSDCSFVASLAVCAVYERRFKKRVVTSCIYPQKGDGTPIYNESGKYVIKLHLNGIPRKIEIDDRLPVDRHGHLLCSHSVNVNELWVSLMEKSYMKVMGGYDFPGSNSNNDLHALTGWLPERLGIHNRHETFASDKEYDRMKAGLHAGQCLITVATPVMSKSDSDRAGLVETHAYAILDMQAVDGKRLLLVKNPWRHLRWKGAFGADDDKNWTPALERKLNYDRQAAKNSDNGVFWISWEALQHFFDVLYINWDPAIFSHKCITHASWAPGGDVKRDSFSYGLNPQYHVEVQAPAAGCAVWVLLSKHVTQKDSFADNKDYITVHIFDGDKRIFYPEKHRVEGVKINSIHYLAKIENVPRGHSHYTLVISQYEQNNTIDYTLGVHSTCLVHLKAMPTIKEMYHVQQRTVGEWTKATAGGCRNNQSTFNLNPKYRLTLQGSGTANLMIELRGPKEYAVGYELSADSASAEAKSYQAPSPGPYRPGYSVQTYTGVPCPGVFQIMPTTYEAGQAGKFFLDVFCSTTYILEVVK